MERADSAGGSIALAELIDEYGEALLRDFLLFYRINLMEVLFTEDETWWSPRLLLSLIERFPEGSEFYAERAGGRHYRDWTLPVQFAAQLINAVNQNTLIAAHATKKQREGFPFITGPDSLIPKEKKKRTFAETVALFGDAPSW